MKHLFNVGDRVKINKVIKDYYYIVSRSKYARCEPGMTGTVIGYTSAKDKIAVEFDEIVFFNHKVQQSSHDNGCHGKGKLHYCWYIPLDCVDLIPKESEQKHLVDLLDEINPIEHVSSLSYILSYPDGTPCNLFDKRLLLL